MTRPSDGELAQEAKRAIRIRRGPRTKAIIIHFRSLYEIGERQAYTWYKRIKIKLQ